MFPTRALGHTGILHHALYANETEQIYCGHDRTRNNGHADEQPLSFMVLDVLEEPGGRFNIWGKTNLGESVLVRIDDFTPYFYMAQPLVASLDKNESNDFDHATCTRLQRALNGCVNLPKCCNLVHVLEFLLPSSQQAPPMQLH